MSDPGFSTYLLDLLEPLGPCRARAMMGGITLFCRELSIGLVVGDRLFLKVDATTREAFARAGGSPFTYEREGKTVEMSYWSPPDDALESPEGMHPWATLALEAAARAKRPRGRKPPR